MRVNIPLIPVVVEVRRRRLPPFRVTLRSLMIGVVMVGLFFALIAFEERTGRAMNDHATQLSLAVQARNPNNLPTSGGPTTVEAWHATMASRYRAEFDRIDILLYLAFMTFAILAVVAAFGRVLDWSSRRPGNPTGDGQSDPRPISTESPWTTPEEYRP